MQKLRLMTSYMDLVNLDGWSDGEDDVTVGSHAWCCHLEAHVLVLSGLIDGDDGGKEELW